MRNINILELILCVCINSFWITMFVFCLQLDRDKHSSLLLWVCAGDGATNGTRYGKSKVSSHLHLWKHHPVYPLGERKDTAGHRMGKTVHSNVHTQYMTESQWIKESYITSLWLLLLSMSLLRWTPTHQTVYSRCWHTWRSCSSSFTRTTSCQRWRTCLTCYNEPGPTFRSPASQYSESSFFILTWL